MNELITRCRLIVLDTYTERLLALSQRVVLGQPAQDIGWNNTWMK
jgi:hypothetical protein